MTPSTRAPRFVPFRNGAVAFVMVLVAGACTIGGSGQGGTSSPGRSFAAPLPKGLETVQPSEAPTVGDVPEAILLQIREDLAARMQGDISGAVVVVAQQVVWSDGSLGCPKPGVLYTQALVPGYQVVLALDGRRYDYRSGQLGTVRLCEQRVPVNRQP